MPKANNVLEIISWILRLIGIALGLAIGSSFILSSIGLFVFALIPPNATIGHFKMPENSLYEAHWAYYLAIIIFLGANAFFCSLIGGSITGNAIKGIKGITQRKNIFH